MKPTIIPIAVLLVTLICACSPGTKDVQILEDTPPPMQPTPILDGIHSPDEWSPGEEFELSDGSTLYYFKVGDWLFLGIQGASPGALGGNIFLHQDNLVRILHISAALGTAEYIPEGESWSRIRDFDWKHRSTGNGEAALAERQAYLEVEGWTAPNAWTGTPQHLETQILLQPGARIAVSLFNSDLPERVVWPVGLQDDTSTTFPDGLPEVLIFAPESWHLIP